MNSQLQTMINNMPEKTGKSLEEWFQLLSAKGFVKHGNAMKPTKKQDNELSAMIIANIVDHYY